MKPTSENRGILKRLDSNVDREVVIEAEDDVTHAEEDTAVPKQTVTGVTSVAPSLCSKVTFKDGPHSPDDDKHRRLQSPPLGVEQHSKKKLIMYVMLTVLMAFVGGTAVGFALCYGVVGK